MTFHPGLPRCKGKQGISTGRTLQDSGLQRHLEGVGHGVCVCVGGEIDSEQVRAGQNQFSPSLIRHVDSEICLVKGSSYAHGSQSLHQLHQNTDSQSDIYSRYTVFQESWMQTWT